MFQFIARLAGAVIGVALCYMVWRRVWLLFLHPSQYVQLFQRILSNPEIPQEELRLEYENEKKPIQVLVLGDIGRSPRMQYHAISAGKHGAQVDIIGYRESELHPDLLANPLISVVALPAVPWMLRTDNKILFLVLGPLKVLWQSWSLWYALAYRTKPAKWLIVQNPPSIPTLAIASTVCSFRNTLLVIDWHNYGWTILALKLGESHILVRIAKWYEGFFGRFATHHWTVTHALAQHLKHNMLVRPPINLWMNAYPRHLIQTLHDRPARHFQPLSPEQREEFLHQCPVTSKYASSVIEEKTRLLVSSTSWTPDEDFSLLLEALVMYSRGRPSNAPSILAIITGKGPRKQYYEKEIQRLAEQNQLTGVTVLTAWLSTQDYASLLGAADLGVSLHTSSSGLDLPMKVVDMFGAGLPVVGWDRFEAWKELVTEGVNGRGFGNAEELSLILLELFTDTKKLRMLKEGALQEGSNDWDYEWDPVAGRCLGISYQARTLMTEYE
ncbi:MAG: hypothetical protein M1823_005159 [Watsoniomyces obsoletus]|nr:MAG: hypothetical protein M1823_005159 [Watsoniomyces obsoletus]